MEKTLMALCAAFLIAGCSTTRGGQFCQTSEPIYATEADSAAISDRLVAALNVHNETGRKLCGWSP